MKKETRFSCALLCLSFLLVACSSRPDPGAERTDPSTPAREADETRVETPPSPLTSDGGPAATTPPQPEPPSQEATRTPPPPPSQPAAPAPVDPPQAAASSPEASGTAGVVDIGGPVEVEPPKAGPSRIGSDKCKLCHKVQYASWSESAHAKRMPPLDCEGCHGPGSEYKGMAVMKDPEQARSAGLVIPDRSFCSKCHKTGWTDDLLKRAHAHEVEGS